MRLPCRSYTMTKSRLNRNAVLSQGQGLLPPVAQGPFFGRWETKAPSSLCIRPAEREARRRGPAEPLRLSGPDGIFTGSGDCAGERVSSTLSLIEVTKSLYHCHGDLITR